MGADRFIAYYGLRFEVPHDDAGIESLEEGTDPRLVAADKAMLNSYFGRVSDGRAHFLLNSTSLGCFGYQDNFQNSVADEELSRVASETRRRLQEAGFAEVPSLLLQFEGQY